MTSAAPPATSGRAAGRFRVKPRSRHASWTSPPGMKADWETAVVVDPRTLESLGKDCRRLRRGTRRLKGALCVTLAGAVVFGRSEERRGGKGWMGRGFTG